MTFHQPATWDGPVCPRGVGAEVAFLASRHNGYVTGADVNVAGGSDLS